ncbi:hypothetical protein KO02_02215 [Sphingobacterium sp. ML3W]|nr:hypothetical protein KO02_02215 [Sphingobacterium sp. ML3W]
MSDFFPPPKSLDTIQRIRPTTMTTTIMPDHTPALKMPSITEQLVKERQVNRINTIGNILFMIYCVLIKNKH